MKVVHLIAILNALSISLAFTTHRTPRLFPSWQALLDEKNNHRKNGYIFTHTKEVSPNLDIPSKSSACSDGSDSNKSISLEELCSYLGATPKDLLYLDNGNDSNSSDNDNNGERGVYLNNSVQKDDILLKIPLSSCICDDKPPLWYDTYKSLYRNDIDDENFHYNPSKWANRLAASLLDLQICSENDSIYKGDDQIDKYNNVNIGLQKWLSMMPNREFLRASLPIHWQEEIVSHAKCTALELSIDASYFARAEALSDLMEAIKVESNYAHLYDGADLERILSNIFDIVQTRSCRAERLDGIHLRPSLRILAPIFDFINHGSHRHNEEGSANAFFGLEGDSDDDGDLSVVVRASKNIEANEEVLIDYGDSARPAWRCLASYGFVPDHRLTSPDYELEEGEEDESVAEVFMDGARYEVGSHTVPFEMVEAAFMSLLEEEQGPQAFGDNVADCFGNNVLLTPEVALRIAKRVSDASFQLLIEPSTGEENKTKHGEEESVSALLSKQLAASLRWSQHKVLLNCAVGLRDYAGRGRGN